MINGKDIKSGMHLCKTLAPSLDYPNAIVDKLVIIVVYSSNKNVERDIVVQKIEAIN